MKPNYRNPLLKIFQKVTDKRKNTLMVKRLLILLHIKVILYTKTKIEKLTLKFIK